MIHGSGIRFQNPQPRLHCLVMIRIVGRLILAMGGERRVEKYSAKMGGGKNAHIKEHNPKRVSLPSAGEAKNAVGFTGVHPEEGRGTG